VCIRISIRKSVCTYSWGVWQASRLTFPFDLPCYILYIDVSRIIAERRLLIFMGWIWPGNEFAWMCWNILIFDYWGSYETDPFWLASHFLRPKICFSSPRFWHILKNAYICLESCGFSLFDNGFWGSMNTSLLKRGMVRLKRPPSRGYNNPVRVEIYANFKTII
jgi:hypothetical protein